MNIFLSWQFDYGHFQVLFWYRLPSPVLKLVSPELNTLIWQDFPFPTTRSAEKCKYCCLLCTQLGCKFIQGNQMGGSVASQATSTRPWAGAVGCQVLSWQEMSRRCFIHCSESLWTSLPLSWKILNNNIHNTSQLLLKLNRYDYTSRRRTCCQVATIILWWDYRLFLSSFFGLLVISNVRNMHFVCSRKNITFCVLNCKIWLTQILTVSLDLSFKLQIPKSNWLFYLNR